MSRREVVPQTPMVASFELAFSSFPVRVSHSIGTSIAIVLTAYPETKSAAKFCAAASSTFVSTPGTPLPSVRKFAVSNVAPRSIQNASSVVPAKTERPFDRRYVPCWNSAS